MEHNVTEEKNEYESQMIEAFVNNSEKTAWYQNSFRKYQVNGIDNMSWNWSWWAFFGGIFFLLYRKAYLAALGLFLLTMVLSVIPFASFVVSILAGGLSTYFVYKEYKKKKAEIETSIDDTQKCIDTMQIIGGYNTWAIWVAGILYALMFLILVAAVSQ